MKKLVKTARRQFEERLEQYGLTLDWVNQGELGRIGKDMGDQGIVIFVHESKDDIFSEYWYPSFDVLRDDAKFTQLCIREFYTMSDAFSISMLRWFAYADEENPLDAVDVFFVAPKVSGQDFSDIYEEVPDVRVITSKEQWENDSKDAKLCCNLDNGTIWKVLVEKDQLVFFRSNDEDRFYYRYDLPSMDNLRKDATFIAEYLSLVQDMHPEDLDSAVTWIKKGVYTMSACSMMDIYQSLKTINSYKYEDKEIEPIIKHNFSNDITAISNVMVEHIVKLHKGGMNLCSELFLGNIGHIVTKDGFIYDTEDIRICYFRVNNDDIYQFSTEYNYDSEGDSNDFLLGELSIETLHQIINAMK